MPPTDSLLSLDMGFSDCLYRIRKTFPHASSVVYVHLQDLSIIDEDRRTYGPSVVNDLREKVDVWDQQWTTLNVFVQSGTVQYELDAWQPHFLPKASLEHIQVPRMNVLDFEVLTQYKNRVSLIQLESRRCFLKICPFKYQLPYLAQEINTYSVLSQRGCSLQPLLLAFVFERSKEQVIGFICEELRGRFATSADYGICERALKELHSHNIIHGDLNKFNLIITPDGPRFIDFEKTTLYTDADGSKAKFMSEAQDELNKLRTVLSDTEGWGRPWVDPER